MTGTDVDGRRGAFLGAGGGGGGGGVAGFFTTTGLGWNSVRDTECKIRHDNILPLPEVATV
jgi:hypothetical protein